MKDSSYWLERQYWVDVIAVRPNERIDQQVAQSKEVRLGFAAALDLAYGPHERQRLDLFCPPGNGPWPLMLFIHGGYWQLGRKEDWAFLAPAWNQQGIAFAVLGYRLLPEVNIREIVSDVRAALRLLGKIADQHSLDLERVLISGISAGAHLSAMAVTDANPAPDAAKPNAAVLLSGVYDLNPVRHTTPGQALKASLAINPSEVSPLSRPAPEDCRCLIATGAEETPVFHSQSKLLASHWENWGVRSEVHTIASANHYTMVDILRGDREGIVTTFIQNQIGKL